MNIKNLIVVGLLVTLDTFGMGAVVAGVEALAENPAAQQLLETVAINGVNTFAHSSTFSTLTASSHGSLVSTALKTLTAAAAQAQAGSAAAPASPASGVAAANNPNQAALNAALQSAQQVEQSLAANPSPWAKVLRIGGGLLVAAYGVADYTVNAYTQNNTDTSKKATSYSLGAPADLTLITGGFYNVYLGITNWDTKSKQADAATTTHLIQGHIAQQSAPAAAPAAAGSASV